MANYNNLYLFIKRHFQSLWPFLTLRKTINVVEALWEMALRKKVCSARPFVYRIDPCSLCNLRCASCITWRTQTKEKRAMDSDDFKTIIGKIKKYALRTSLYDMGEPLMHKEIYKMISYASDNNISTLISTNFNLFSEKNLEELFGSRLTVLEPCLDGFSQENYEKYRRGGDINKVKDSIRMVMEYKRKKKKKYPIVDVQVVKFDHIKEELPLIDNFLKNECQVDKITYRQENLGFNSPETTIAGKQISQEKTCFWLYLGMMIRPDGNVYPCCGGDFDRFSYGNIFKEDLGEIWNNKYYQFARALFKKGDLEADPEMKKIPCLKCIQFRKLAKVKFKE